MTPGRKFWTTTSAVSASFMITSCAAAALRFRATLRLLRFQARKFGLSEPPTHLAKKVIERNRSPGPARSILMTFAPSFCTYDRPE